MAPGETRQGPIGAEPSNPIARFPLVIDPKYQLLLHTFAEAPLRIQKLRPSSADIIGARETQDIIHCILLIDISAILAYNER